MGRRCLGSLLGLGVLLAPFLLPTRAVGPLDRSHFQPEQGHAYVIDLSVLGVNAPSDDGGTSELVLSEDGVPLPSAHQQHKAIRAQGGGRYSHWNQALYLSASDNSDPRTNGRSYTLTVPRGLRVAGVLTGPWSLAKIAWLTVCLGGALLVLLPWSPLTASDRALRTAWLRRRTLPGLGLVVVVAAIGYLLHRNALDVTSPAAKALHAGLGLLLVLAFAGHSFWNWRTERRERLWTRAPRSGRPLAVLVTGGLHFAMILLAIECVARVFPAHDSMAINPGARYFWPDYWQAANSLGYNDREPGPKQGPRVLLLGDSYTEGAGVPRHARFADRLQVLLRRAHPGAEVFAGGRCGMDTGDEADLLERTGDRIEPDVVVVCYVLNDAERGSPVQFAPPNPVFQFASGQLRSYAAYRVQCVARAAGDANWPRVIQAQHQPDSAGWQRVQDGLDRIGRWCDRRNVRKMLVVFPLFHEGAEECRPVMDQVVEAAKTRGFEAHSLLDAFGGRWQALALSAYDSHPGAEAHALTAARLAELIGRIEARPSVGVQASAGELP
jgi:hypothetical protein